ncbi:SgrR family transcriptional regulator [Shigella boydii]
MNCSGFICDCSTVLTSINVCGNLPPESRTVTISELAERWFGSERHVRTLSRQAQKAGWLEWQAQSGRGKAWTITLSGHAESLRNVMMEQALETAKQQDARERRGGP